jgi:nicotinamidase-related amidase
MKKLFAILLFLLSFCTISHSQKGNNILLLIDIQDFYFPGGRSALVEPEKAAANAALLLDHFRKNKQEVIHVRHNSEPGGQINKMVLPLNSEKVFSKNEVNCFKGTDLHDYIKSINADTLVVCGMQTHMCAEAAVRAGSDFGYKIILVHDACATKDLTFEGKTIKAQDVHLSTLATLKNYAMIMSTNQYLTR